jgi:hypothetical protein
MRPLLGSHSLSRHALLSPVQIKAGEPLQVLGDIAAGEQRQQLDGRHAATYAGFDSTRDGLRRATEASQYRAGVRRERAAHRPNTSCAPVRRSRSRSWPWRSDPVRSRHQHATRRPDATEPLREGRRSLALRLPGDRSVRAGDRRVCVSTAGCEGGSSLLRAGHRHDQGHAFGSGNRAPVYPAVLEELVLAPGIAPSGTPTTGSRPTMAGSRRGFVRYAGSNRTRALGS